MQASRIVAVPQVERLRFASAQGAPGVLVGGGWSAHDDRRGFSAGLSDALTFALAV